MKLCATCLAVLDRREPRKLRYASHCQQCRYRHPIIRRIAEEMEKSAVKNAQKIARKILKELEENPSLYYHQIQRLQKRKERRKQGARRTSIPNPGHSLRLPSSPLNSQKEVLAKC